MADKKSLVVRLDPPFYDGLSYFAGSTGSSIATFTRVAITRHASDTFAKLYSRYEALPEEMSEERAALLVQIKSMHKQLGNMGITMLL